MIGKKKCYVYADSNKTETKGDLPSVLALICTLVDCASAGYGVPILNILAIITSSMEQAKNTGRLKGEWMGK